MISLILYFIIFHECISITIMNCMMYFINFIHFSEMCIVRTETCSACDPGVRWKQVVKLILCLVK